MSSEKTTVSGQDNPIKDASVRVGKALARSSFKAEEAGRKAKDTARKLIQPAKKKAVLKPDTGLTTSTQFGFVAGDIYAYLNENGRTEVDKVVRAMTQRKSTTGMVYCAIGWLAREEKIQFTPDGSEMELCPTF